MVVGVRENSVRIGVAAPPSMIVDRMEIHKRRSEQSCAADLIGAHGNGEVSRR
jgi:sRNA-binding carbon storage regulator CsrA